MRAYSREQVREAITQAVKEADLDIWRQLKDNPKQAQMFIAQAGALPVLERKINALLDGEIQPNE